MSRPFQIHAPYELLLVNLDLALKERLNPEIYFSGAVLDGLDVQEARGVAQTLERHNLTVTFHGPYMDLFPGSPDSKVRGVALERLSQAVELAAVFKPRAIVCHLGYHREMSEKDYRDWFNNSLECWRTVAKLAGRLKSTVALENVYEESPDPIVAILNGANSSNLGTCLDVGHRHIYSRVGVSEWVRALTGRLTEVHLHDNHGLEDEHLPIGQGTVDFQEFFSSVSGLRERPLLTIEPLKKEHIELHIAGLAPFLPAYLESAK